MRRVSKPRNLESKVQMAAMRERERQAGLVRPQLLAANNTIEAARKLGTERGADLQMALGALVAVALEVLDRGDQEFRDRYALALDNILIQRGRAPRNQTEFDLTTAA